MVAFILGSLFGAFMMVILLALLAANSDKKEREGWKATDEE